MSETMFGLLFSTVFSIIAIFLSGLISLWVAKRSAVLAKQQEMIFRLWELMNEHHQKFRFNLLTYAHSDETRNNFKHFKEADIKDE